MAEKLVEHAVELKVEGMEGVRKAFAEAQAGPGPLATAARPWGGALASAALAPARALGLAWAGAAAGLGQLQAAGTALTPAFTAASGALMGWVRAGMAGTAEAEMLSLQMGLLHREVANIFAPAVQKVVGFVTDLAAKFRSLSGDQQEQIRHWVGVGAAAVGVLVVVPRLTAALQSMGAVMKVLAMNPFALAVAGLAAVMAGTEEGRSSFADLWEAIKPIGEALAEIFQALTPVITQIAGALTNVLVPAFKVLGKVIEVALLPLKLAAQALRSVYGTAAFSTQHGETPLAQLHGEERAREVAARERELQARTQGIGQSQAVGQTSVGGIAATALSRLFGGDADNEAMNIAASAQRLARERREAAAADRARPRTELTPRGGGMESAEAVFTRLQTAANKVVSPELQEAQRQTTIQQRLLDYLQQTMGRTPTTQAPAVTT